MAGGETSSEEPEKRTSVDRPSGTPAPSIPGSALGTAWRFLFSRLDFQADIVAPVVEKLLAGAVLFAIVASSKQWLYPLIWLKPADPGYPIYASGEAFTNPTTGLVEGELYIANLWNGELTIRQLEDRVIDRRVREPRDIDTDIFVRWNIEGHHVTLEETNDDKSFNAGKGRLDIKPVDDDPPEWRIKVLDINRGAMMRLHLKSDLVRVTTRGDVLTLPFTVTNPRNR